MNKPTPIDERFGTTKDSEGGVLITFDGHALSESTPVQIFIEAVAILLYERDQLKAGLALQREMLKTARRNQKPTEIHVGLVIAISVLASVLAMGSGLLIGALVQ